MRVWHEDLIHKLCTKHLEDSYHDGMKIFTIIKFNKKRYQNNLMVREFEGSPLKLIYKLHLIYKEARKRGLKLEKPPSPYDLVDEPLFQARLQHNRYVEWQTIDEQITILKGKECECDV